MISMAVKRAPAKDDLKSERQALRQAQVQRLFDEIVGAGCGFRIEFEELRLTNMSAMNTDQSGLGSMFSVGPMSLSHWRANTRRASRWGRRQWHVPEY